MEALRHIVRARLWQAYLVVGTLLCALYVWVPPFTGSGPVMSLIGLSPVVAIVAGVRLYRPASQMPWYLFAVGFLLFWFGDLYTYSYPRLLDKELPVSFALTGPVTGLLGAQATLIAAGLLGGVITVAALALPGMRAIEGSDGPDEAEIGPSPAAAPA